ncbi:MAG: hypothetical protein R3F30_09070 [Planctomycetota bacterium]
MADAEEHSDDLPEAIGEHRVAGLRRRDGVGLLCEAAGDDPERPLLLRTLGPRWRLSTAAQERFRELASATRRAAHHGIARVAEVGEHGGLPFCVLDAGPSRCLDALLTELVDTTGARRPKEARRLGELLAGRRIDAAFEELWGSSWTDMSADLALPGARALEHAPDRPRARGPRPARGPPRRQGSAAAVRLRPRPPRLDQRRGRGRRPPDRPRFLAPRVLDGAPPTPASDLWSLGVLLCACCAAACRSRPTTRSGSPRQCAARSRRCRGSSTATSRARSARSCGSACARSRRAATRAPASWPRTSSASSPASRSAPACPARWLAASRTRASTRCASCRSRPPWPSSSPSSPCPAAATAASTARAGRRRLGQQARHR